MDPGAAIMDADRLTAPRACGDGPMRAKTWYYVQVCSPRLRGWTHHAPGHVAVGHLLPAPAGMDPRRWHLAGVHVPAPRACGDGDRKSTRLNSSHANISYAVFCLKKKKHTYPNSCIQKKKNKQDDNK